MVEIEYERKAMNGEAMPEGLGWPDQVLYLQLRMLYDQYKKGIVSRDAAAKEKHQMVEEYKLHRSLDALQTHTDNMWKQIEITAHDYAKNPSVETADKLFEAIYGVKRKGA